MATKRNPFSWLLLAGLLIFQIEVFAAPWAFSQVYLDSTAAISVRVEDLMQRMTLEEKIGQMTQVDRRYLKQESDIATYFLGSLLSGGGSAPEENTPEAWADMYDRFQHWALTTRLRIPLLYGIDAVHGHNNVKGAVIFPHNIGMGCTRNPELVREAARITAIEVAATGIDWTFAPCIAVPRDERWGRTYEGFGETPELTRVMSAAAVSGFQGDTLADPSTILACAKHFIGDGGTREGRDQGNTILDEQSLRAIHLPGYQAAVTNGVATIMASYNSWNGQKVHGNRYLLTTLLKQELGFSGFVVSDWAAIDQLPGDYASDIEKAINAGIDMVMVPDRYQEFITTLKSLVAHGKVPLSRIDDAVRRILTKKFEAGLFERPFTNRSLLASVGSSAHRAIARRCVRQSLVLLKKKDGILPLAKSNIRIHVAGKNGDDLGNQCGGWTISWQGGSGPVTTGTTILEGIRQVAPGATVTYSRDGSGGADAEVGIVVIGETPYAEGNGDRSDLSLSREDIAAVRNVKRSGIPTVVILISGRPMILAPILHFADVLIAAWLPGTEGQGVADILFGDFQPKGKLSHSWPRSMAQIPMNKGDDPYDPLFPYDFGLTSLDDSAPGSPPVFFSALVLDTGTELEVSFNKPISAQSIQASEFQVVVDSQSPIPVTAAGVKREDPTTIRLTLAVAVQDDEHVTVAYSGESVRSQDGGSLAPFAPEEAYNLLSEIAALPVIPGKIEAEDYSRMYGVQTEATNDVGGGLNVGWIDTNDWLEYEVVVQTSGTYELGLRVASLSLGGKIQVAAPGSSPVTVTLPQTGGWQNWKTVKTRISLQAGRQKLRVAAIHGGFNLNWLRFSLVTGVTDLHQPPEDYSLLPNFPNPFSESTNIVCLLPADETISLKVFNLVGQEVFSEITQHPTTGLFIRRIELRHAPDGIYFLQLTAGRKVFHQKLVRMR